MFTFSKDWKKYVWALGFALLLSQFTATGLKIDLKLTKQAPPPVIILDDLHTGKPCKISNVFKPLGTW